MSTRYANEPHKINIKLKDWALGQLGASDVWMLVIKSIKYRLITKLLHR
jgi:hypothetical protein